MCPSSGSSQGLYGTASRCTSKLSLLSSSGSHASAGNPHAGPKASLADILRAAADTSTRSRSAAAAKQFVTLLGATLRPGAPVRSRFCQNLGLQRRQPPG